MIIELAYYLEWLIRIAAVLVISRHRRPVTALAWLAIILFQPYLGLLLYLSFQPAVLRQRRLRRAEALEAFMGPLRMRMEALGSLACPLLPARAGRFAAFVQALGLMPLVGGNRASLLPSEEAFFGRLLAEIGNARRHVHLLFYIVGDDAVGRRFAEALAEAAGRGVACRVLADGLGSRRFLRRHGRSLRRAGVEVRAALPVRLVRRLFERLDMRNHRKLAVIDGRIGYTGSQNLADPFYGHRTLRWHDLMVRMTGPAVTELQATFAADWKLEGGSFREDEDLFPEPEGDGEELLQILPSGPFLRQENYQRLVVSALHHARELVTITTPYLIPAESFLEAIETAVLRGVRVDIVVPLRSDQHLPGLAARSYYETLLNLGARLFLFEPGLLHAKTMTVDGDLAFMGSSNFDIRSFSLNFEINVVFYGPEMVSALQARQEAFLLESTELTLEAWNRRPRWIHIPENLARLFSPLL